MPWFQEQFCSVSKSKFAVIETQDISLENKYILMEYILHYNVQANEVGQLYQFRAFLPNLYIFKKFLGTDAFNRKILNACFPFRMRAFPICFTEIKKQTRWKGFLAGITCMFFHFCSCLWFKINWKFCVNGDLFIEGKAFSVFRAGP